MWQFWDYEGEKKRKETGEQSVLNSQVQICV